MSTSTTTPQPTPQHPLDQDADSSSPSSQPPLINTEHSEKLHSITEQLEKLRETLSSLQSIETQLKEFSNAIKASKKLPQGDDQQKPKYIKMKLPLLLDPLCFIEAEYRLSEEGFVSVGEGYFRKMSILEMLHGMQEKIELLDTEINRLERQYNQLNQKIFRGTEDMDELFEKLELEEKMEEERKMVDSGDVDEEFDKYFVKNADVEEQERKIIEQQREAEQEKEFLSDDEDEEAIVSAAAKDTDLGIRSYGAATYRAQRRDAEFEQESMSADHIKVPNQEIIPGKSLLKSTSGTAPAVKRVSFGQNVRDNASPPHAHIDLPVPPRNPALVRNEVTDSKPKPVTAPSAVPKEKDALLQQRMDMINAPIKAKSARAPPIQPRMPSFPSRKAAPSFPGAGTAQPATGTATKAPQMPSFPSNQGPSFPAPPNVPSDNTTSQTNNNKKKMSRFMQQLQQQNS